MADGTDWIYCAAHGLCEFTHTNRLAPFSNPWNRVRLLHVEDIPMVLAAGAATFIVLTLLLRLLEKIPPISERKDLEAVLSMRLLR